jgi:hypothetical protein
MKTNGEVKPGRILKLKESIKHTFNNEELLDMSKSCARTHQELDALNGEKDRVVADFKAQIQSKENSINDYSRRISNGYEYRMVECELHYHDPSKGMKTLFRVDTGDEVRSTKMEAHEMQDVLFEEPANFGSEVVRSAVDQINAGILNTKDLTVTAKVGRINQPDWVDNPHGKKEKSPRA